jgi:hypothetical protein
MLDKPYLSPTLSIWDLLHLVPLLSQSFNSLDMFSWLLPKKQDRPVETILPSKLLLRVLHAF